MNFNFVDDAVLGSGTYGEVLLGEMENERVAVKRRFQPQGMEYEAQLLERCDHNNVIGYKGYFNLVDEFYLIMDLAPGGTLQRHLGRGRFTVTQRQSFVQQICSGLEHIHSNGIVHRNINADNILFADTVLTRLVIAGFGMAQLRNANQLENNNHLVVRDHHYDFKSDVYLLGLVAYQILEDSANMDMINMGEYIRLRASRENGFDKEVFRREQWLVTIALSVHQDPEMRPTVAEFHQAFF